MLEEIRIKEFVKENQPRINIFFKQFQELFNEIGEKYSSGKMQKAFTGIILAGLLQTSNMPKNEAETACKIALSTIKK